MEICDTDSNNSCVEALSTEDMVAYNSTGTAYDVWNYDATLLLIRVCTELNELFHSLDLKKRQVKTYLIFEF